MNITNQNVQKKGARVTRMQPSILQRSQTNQSSALPLTPPRHTDSAALHHYHAARVARAGGAAHVHRASTAQDIPHSGCGGMGCESVHTGLDNNGSIPRRDYGRPVGSSQAPRRCTRGYKATTDPGRPRRSEARPCPCTCTQAHTTTSFHGPDCWGPYTPQSGQCLRSPTSTGSHRMPCGVPRGQRHSGSGAQSET